MLTSRLEENNLNLKSNLFTARFTLELVQKPQTSQDLLSLHFRYHMVAIKYFVKDPINFSFVVSDDLMLDEYLKTVLFSTYYFVIRASGEESGPSIAIVYQFLDEICALVFSRDEAARKSKVSNVDQGLFINDTVVT